MKTINLWRGVVAVGVLLVGRAGNAQTKPDAAPALVTQFTYRATVPIPADTKQELRCWLPLPSTDQWQTVSDLTVESPVPYQITRESKYGNRMLFLQASHPTASLVVTARFTVVRREVRVLDTSAADTKATGKATNNSETKETQARRDLKPDTRVASDSRYTQIAREVIGDKTDSQAKMQALFEHVVASMEYDYKKESPLYALGDAAWVCDYKKGNCSDLHSYLIALARSQNLPAVLEFGFPLTGIPLASPLPTEGSIGGYHCWMWVNLPGKGDVPLDASDARRWLDAKRPDVKARLFGSLVTERAAVAMSRGRDLTLVPAQKAAPLNYFIYPYAEADGKPVDAQWEVRYHLVSGAKEATK